MEQKRAKTRSPRMRVFDQIRDLTTFQQNKIKNGTKKREEKKPYDENVKNGMWKFLFGEQRPSKGLVLGSLIRMICLASGCSAFAMQFQ